MSSHFHSQNDTLETQTKNATRKRPNYIVVWRAGCTIANHEIGHCWKHQQSYWAVMKSNFCRWLRSTTVRVVHLISNSKIAPQPKWHCNSGIQLSMPRKSVGKQKGGLSCGHPMSWNQLRRHRCADNEVTAACHKGAIRVERRREKSVTWQLSFPSTPCNFS